MHPRPDEDAVRDGLALAEAVAREDLEAVRVLLDNADLRTTATFLAGIVTDLVIDLSEWCRQDPDAMYAKLREHHAGGTGNDGKVI